MSKVRKVAIIGIGAIAGMHARALGDIPSVKLVAGSCRNQEKGQKFAQQFNCQWYADYEKMLDEQKPDMVTICTPSGAHLEPMLAAAKRGIHVLCEKPLEITTDRVDQMIAAAKQYGILLGGFFQADTNPSSAPFTTPSPRTAWAPWPPSTPTSPGGAKIPTTPQPLEGKLKYDGGGA